MWPDAVREVIRKLETMNGGIIGLVGLQGVSKSSALLAIAGGRTLLQGQEYRRTHASGECPELGGDIVTFALRHWERGRKGPIDTTIVKEAVTVERLAEDMERELTELFPKQSDLRLQAVRLLILLEEFGPKKQSEFAEELGLEGYAMSRLLAKLELHRYITRRREGTDKIVSLLKTSAQSSETVH